MIGFACGFWLACLVCSRCLVSFALGGGCRAASDAFGAAEGRPERDRAGFGDMGSVPMWRWMLGIPGGPRRRLWAGPVRRFSQARRRPTVRGRAVSSWA